MTPKYNKDILNGFNYNDLLKKMQEQGQNAYSGLQDTLGKLGNNVDLSSLTKGVNEATGAVKDFFNPDSKLNMWNFTQPKSQRDKEAEYKQLNDSVVNYKGSFSDQLNAITDKINNREPFKYDLSGDTVFQNAKDQYLKNAKMGMTDAMAQAAALTGGYGNSYAQQAGYQAYQNNLDSLNDMIPGLYEAAMKRYQLEGDDLMNQYGVLSDRDNTEYQRLLGNRDFAYNDWANERDYQTALNQYKQQMMYQGLRDLVGDAKWGAEFGREVGQDAFNNGMDIAKFGWGAGQDLFSNGMDIAKYGLDAGTSIYDRLYQAAQDKIANDLKKRQFEQDVAWGNWDREFQNANLQWDNYWKEKNYNEGVRQYNTDDAYRKSVQAQSGGTSGGSTNSNSSNSTTSLNKMYGVSDIDKSGYSKSNGAYYTSEGAYWDSGKKYAAPIGNLNSLRRLNLDNAKPEYIYKLIESGELTISDTGVYAWGANHNGKTWTHARNSGTLDLNFHKPGAQGGENKLMYR